MSFACREISTVCLLKCFGIKLNVLIPYYANIQYYQFISTKYVDYIEINAIKYHIA